MGVNETSRDKVMAILDMAIAVVGTKGLLPELKALEGLDRTKALEAASERLLHTLETICDSVSDDIEDEMGEGNMLWLLLDNLDIVEEKLS